MNSNSNEPAEAALSDAGSERIFSGDASGDMWEEINALDELSTGDQVRDVLYTICCRLQQLEAVVRSNVEVCGQAAASSPRISAGTQGYASGDGK